MIKVPFDDPKELSEHDKAKVVAANMIKFGGGFARMLGTRLAQMNLEEIEDFKKSWPSYWNRFGKMAEAN